MSVGTLHQNDKILIRRSQGRLFGRFIAGVRENQNRSIEQVATLAGMTMCEWLAVEAGRVPNDPNQLRQIADALEVGHDKIAIFALICREAWD